MKQEKGREGDTANTGGLCVPLQDSLCSPMPSGREIFWPMGFPKQGQDDKTNIIAQK